MLLPASASQSPGVQVLCHHNPLNAPLLLLKFEGFVPSLCSWFLFLAPSFSLFLVSAAAGFFLFTFSVIPFTVTFSFLLRFSSLWWHPVQWQQPRQRFWVSTQVQVWVAGLDQRGCLFQVLIRTLNNAISSLSVFWLFIFQSILQGLSAQSSFMWTMKIFFMADSGTVETFPACGGPGVQLAANAFRCQNRPPQGHKHARPLCPSQPRMSRRRSASDPTGPFRNELPLGSSGARSCTPRTLGAFPPARALVWVPSDCPPKATGAALPTEGTEDSRSARCSRAFSQQMSFLVPQEPFILLFMRGPDSSLRQ
ncbi:uncharacterized protein LOC106027859 [Cavia porcellus]|uniref:uncharacterized protein LOC106027859 n=1 Tax=Cavia porcellus TaxID=10141 RepID=UPI002FE1CC45